MYQVGDSVELMIAPIPSGSVIYSYIWDYWDGTSDASARPFAVKVVNIGGQPGTDELHYTCHPVAVDGQAVALNGTITANNPPTILPGVDITANDGYFAYQTELSLQAIDQDGDSLAFAWYSAGTYLGAGVSTAAGLANGTWTGNQTQIIAAYPATRNSLDVLVTANALITCYVSDNRGGTTTVDYQLRGQAEPPPSATTTAGFGNVAFDATTPPVARIGAGQTVNFTVYVPPLPAHSVAFQWTFSGSKGWTMPPVYDSGITAVLPNGGYQNTVLRDISLETVSSGTQKTVTADVRVVTTHLVSGAMDHADADYTLSLVANSAPSAVTVVRSVGGVPVIGAGPVPGGSKIEFAATGVDVDDDVLFCHWQLAQPFAPNPIHFWGPKVLYDTSGYAPGSSVQGSLTLYDWLGRDLVVTLPSTNIS